MERKKFRALAKAVRQILFGGMYRRAVEAQRFALPRFAQLDVKRDGLITEEDLEAALQSDIWSKADRKTIRYIQRHIDSIGHVLRTERTEITQVVPMGTIAGPVRQVVFVRVYGIDKDDLRRYPDLIRFKFLV